MRVQAVDYWRNLSPFRKDAERFTLSIKISCSAEELQKLKDLDANSIAKTLLNGE